MVFMPSDNANLAARARDSVATITDEAGVEINADAKANDCLSYISPF